MLVYHDFQSFVQIAVDLLHKHGIVIPTGEDAAVNFEEIEGFPTNPKEFAVLVEDNRMAETIVHDDLHNRGCKSVGKWVDYQLHGCKRGHSATGNEIISNPSKPTCFPTKYPLMWRTIIGASIGK